MLFIFSFGENRRSNSASQRREATQYRYSVAAGTTFLYWWAFDVSERAENAAIPFIWLQQRIARFAFVVILTGISWHDLRFTVVAVWASQGRF
jgi:hypothetical protein